MKKQWKRTLSIVLSVAMLFGMTGINTVFATEGGRTIGASGLCEHHRSHTADCGYTAGTQEAPCTHEHTDDCYKDETPTASDSNAQELDCRHSHDDDCGYAPAVPGTPCTFQCEECGDKDNALFAITKQPADQTAAEGEAVSFSLSASGEGLSYQWQTASMLEDGSAFTRADIADPAALTWSDVEGADEASYTFDVTLADLYENFYRCVVADGTGQMLTSQIVTVSETENPLTKAGWTGGTLFPEIHIFVPAAAGYGEQAAQVFTVTNEGVAPADNLTATLGANSDFEITAALSPTTLEVGAAATVSIRPKTGLAAGTYTDTLTVTSRDGNLTKTASLSFTVHDASSSVDVTTEAALKAALTKASNPNFTINVTEDIALTGQGTINLGASHILNVALGKTVTINGDTMIDVGVHSLTIKGAGKKNSTLVCNRTSGYALYSSGTNGTLRLDELTVNVTSGNGINVRYTDIGSGARIVLNSPDKSNLVRCSQSLTVSGEIDIQAFFNTAIVIDSGTMTIKDGGTVKVGEGSAGGSNRGIEVYSTYVLDVESGGTLTGGTQAGGIFLNSNSKVAGMADKLADRGETLAENGQVTVAQSGTASATGLTAGNYIWNGSLFAKGKAPGSSVVNYASGSFDYVIGNDGIGGGDGFLPQDNENSAGNTVNVTGGAVEWGIYGGYYSTWQRLDVTANDNTVNIASSFTGGGSSPSVYGGFAQTGKEDSGGGTADAGGNTVNIDGGTLGEILGGLATSHDGPARATGNRVNFTGGTANSILGAKAFINTTDSTHPAAATGNHVSISGGRVTGFISGGSISVRNERDSAINNTVTVKGTPDLTSAALYGGAKDGFVDDRIPCDVKTGNTLNLHSPVAVKSVENFEKLSFHLPSGMVANGTMLTVTAPTDLTGVTVDVKFDTTAPTWKVNDVITLISGVSGTYTGNVTVSEYTFALSVSGGKLIATVTAAPSSGGGSGGGGGGGRGNSGGGTKPTGTTTTDQQKGKVNSLTGIITGTGSGYSNWQPETKADGTTSWKLRYADGTTAAGTMVTDASGKTYEQPAWEMVNGAWYPFGADGYVKSGMVLDPALGGYFYIDINTGMKTGWQMIDGKWYYFNPASDGKRGILFTDTWIDGWYVDKNGIWNEEEKKAE